MRNPSIHIDQSKLIDFIEEYNKREELSIPAKSLAKYLLRRGKFYQLSHRVILENKKKTRRKAFSIQSSPEEDAYLFESTLRLVRQKAHHKGIRKFKETSKEWNQIKESAGLALEFCKSFELEKKWGFECYIQELLDLPSKFSLQSTPRKFDWVVDRYESKLSIQSDDYPEFTEEIFIYYQQTIYQKTGNNFNYKNSPEKYVHFIDAGKIARELGLSAEQYVQGHFDSISWANGIPLPQTLAAQGSIDKIIRWMGENDIKKGESPDITGEELANIIKYGKKS